MPKDYAYTEDFDLLIENGDFKTIESTTQHQKDIILANNGEIRLYPYMGVGIGGYALDDQFGDLNGKIREHFELDGQTVEQLEVYEDGTVKVKASYP